MSSISNYLSAAGAAAMENSKPTTDSSAAKPAGNDTLATKEVFIQLLVAQLKNQDPMTPSDPMQFVTQLAQFTSLEQSLGMRQDLSSIRSAVETLAVIATKPATSETVSP